MLCPHNLQEPLYLKTAHGKYVCAESNGMVVANRDTPSDWERFFITPAERGLYQIRTFHETYVIPDPSLTCVRAIRGAALGERFAVTFLPGGKVQFRTHHGKYLCAESDGRLVCDRDTPKEWETFTIVSCKPIGQKIAEGIADAISGVIDIITNDMTHDRKIKVLTDNISRGNEYIRSKNAEIARIQGEIDHVRRRVTDSERELAELRRHPVPQPVFPSQPGYPQPGYPQPGYPQPGYPQPGYPQPGYPQPGYPQPGYPRPGYPGYPAGMKH